MTREGNCHLVVKFPQNIPAFITSVGFISISINQQLAACLPVCQRVSGSLEV